MLVEMQQSLAPVSSAPSGCCSRPPASAAAAAGIAGTAPASAPLVKGGGWGARVADFGIDALAKPLAAAAVAAPAVAAAVLVVHMACVAAG